MYFRILPCSTHILNKKIEWMNSWFHGNEFTRYIPGISSPYIPPHRCIPGPWKIQKNRCSRCGLACTGLVLMSGTQAASLYAHQVDNDLNFDKSKFPKTRNCRTDYMIWILLLLLHVIVRISGNESSDHQRNWKLERVGNRWLISYNFVDTTGMQLEPENT